MSLVEHHTKYLEVHGEDETIWMTRSEHKLLHQRLRKDGKCNIPFKDLRKISLKAIARTPKHRAWINNYNKENLKKLSFTDTIVPFVSLRISITFNKKTERITVSSGFEAYHGRKLISEEI